MKEDEGMIARLLKKRMRTEFIWENWVSQATWKNGAQMLEQY
jgi:hypothetical protein